ncbi:hypothetical protein LTR78_002644 [Recurvomyces mirabilis]|uniref:Carboxymuconolactone decarboxylase-like domain-containing protein n=1 Tax=Recurvomyces mirabilis TaxID=574656 RepID=A0AAE0WTL4_9PEZI|nr:hypothetical protein LTR78_002644 [Recurvomyces mirabilis]KAK5157573.1 hypothetical protein LTS14_004338 [Recurvomyces mirabilis]
MRIPYAPTSPIDPTPENEAIYQRIRDRRNLRPLIPLDLALLHNPDIADGYSKFVGAIRSKSSVPLPLAELAICYVAVLNKATYEWTAHAPICLKAGTKRDVLELLLEAGSDIAAVQKASVLSEVEKLVLAFTYQSTKEIVIQEDVMEELKREFTDQQVMELTITVGAYNMVSRFLVGLDVTESNGRAMEMPKEA